MDWWLCWRAQQWLLLPVSCWPGQATPGSSLSQTDNWQTTKFINQIKNCSCWFSIVFSLQHALPCPALPSTIGCVCCQLAANYTASALRIRPVRTPQKEKINLLKFSNLLALPRCCALPPLPPSPLQTPSLTVLLSPFLSFFLSFWLARCHLLHSRTIHMLNSLPVWGLCARLCLCACVSVCACLRVCVCVYERIQWRVKAVEGSR